MSNQYNNSFDRNFAYRLIMAGISSTLSCVVITIFAALPLIAALGPLFGLIGLLGVFSIMIALIGDAFRLIPFSVISITRGSLNHKMHKHAVLCAKRTFYALPLTFSASMTWVILLFEATGGGVPMVFTLFLIPVGTLLALMVNTAVKTAYDAFIKSVNMCIFMLVLMVIMIPAPEKGDEKYSPVEHSGSLSVPE